MKEDKLNIVLNKIHELQSKLSYFKKNDDLRKYYNNCISILSKYYFNNNKTDNLIGCFNILYTSEGYQFENNKNKISSTQYKAINKISDNIIEYFKDAEQLVNKNDALSISIQCINSKLNGVRLSNKNINKKAYFIECNLSELFGIYYERAKAEKVAYNFIAHVSFQKIITSSIFKKIAIDFNIPEQIIERIKFLKMLALYYHLFIQNGNTDFNLYFIRPRYDLKEFNGVLLLYISRELNKSEISELNLILKDIFLLPAISRAYQLAKYREWRNIIDETSHSLNTSFGSLESSLNKIYYSHHNNTIDTNKIIESEYNYLKSEIDYLREVTTLELRIMETGEDGANFQNLSRERKKEIRIKKFPLSPVLHDIIDRILNSLKYMAISKQKVNLLKTNSIPYLKKEILLLNKINIIAVPVAFQILIQDLIKNMLYYSDEKKSIVSISHKIEDSNLVLSFSNNTVINENAYDLFTNGEEKDGQYFKYKAGIRNINRILNWSKFSKSKWQLKIPDYNILKLNRSTVINLIIPFECYSYEENK